MRSINSFSTLLVKRKPLLYLLFVFAVSSCENATSKPIPGFATKEGGLTCNDIYLSNSSGKINTNNFVYGDKISVNFNNIKGFKKENGKVFAGLSLVVLNKDKDTIIYNHDLNANNLSGLDYSSLLLYSKMTLADPIQSNKSYKAYIHIWDKKGTGTFDASLNYNVIPDPKIQIENKGLTYDDLYLYSVKRNQAIISNVIPKNENIYFVFKGLRGFTTEEGKSLIGLSLKITDADGNIAVNESDLTGETPIDADGLQKSLAPHFSITEGNPDTIFTCSLRIWDKRSDREIKASVKLSLENAN